MIATLRAWCYRLALRLASHCGSSTKQSQYHYRLAILKLDRLGDAVLSLGAVKHLVGGLAEEDTLLIVSPIAEPLFRAEFPETAMLVLPSFCERFWPDFLIFLWRHTAQLRALSVESLVCLRHQPSDYLHAIARLISPQRCHASTWDKPWGSVCLTFPAVKQTPYPLTGGEVCFELEAHRRVVGAAVGREVKLAEVMPAISFVTPSFGDSLVVCPQAGSSIREYPPALLAEALQLFLKHRSMPVHFCVAPGTDAGPWQQALGEAGLVGVTWHIPATFMDLLMLLANARLVLAMESAPAHLAAAMDKAGVFLLGGGHFGMFAPWKRSDRQIWLRHEMECYQCWWHCIHPEPYCITQIEPDAVAAAMLEAVGGPR
ncbi:MAG: glycosyltransferase family 9 protein [Prosthecobacter sp.]